MRARHDVRSCPYMSGTVEVELERIIAQMYMDVQNIVF